MSKKSDKEASRVEALSHLHEVLKPGSIVYTTCNHVSSSGMSRSISLVVVDPRDNDLFKIDYLVACVLDYRLDDKRGGVRVGGCGMDMGFHLVYGLGRRMWPDGTPSPHGKRNGVSDSDGGYALKHRWL